MIFLIWYLIIGSVILIPISAFHALTSIHDAEKALITNRHHNTWWYRILSHVLFILAFVFLFIPCWPILLYIKIRDSYFVPPPTRQAPPAQLFNPFEPFVVVQADLLEQLTVQSIEQREMVYDPLGAVPGKPFGHLNSAWINFIRDVGEDEQIWSFSATWPRCYGGKGLKKGYVIVNGYSIGRHFLTMDKRIINSADN